MCDSVDPSDDKTGPSTLDGLMDGQSYLASRRNTEVVEDDFNLVGAVVNVRSSLRSTDGPDSKALERFRDTVNSEDDFDLAAAGAHIDISRQSSERSVDGQSYLEKRKDTEVMEDDFNLVAAVVNTTSLSSKSGAKRRFSDTMLFTSSAPAKPFFTRERAKTLQYVEEEEKNVRRLRRDTEVLEDDVSMVAAVVVNSSPEGRCAQSSSSMTASPTLTPISNSLQAGATAEAITDAMQGAQ